MERQGGNVPEEVDLLIIGGGPAGSSTALHLERINPGLANRTLVVDKKSHPRNKICGGALTLHAELIIADLGIELNVPFAPVHHVRLVYGKAHIDLPEHGCAKRVIRRCEFDDLLFQAVKSRGIRTMENVSVTKVVRQPNHLLVVTNRGQIRAKVVVSADGVNAILRKTRGFGPGKMTRLYATETPADASTEPVFTEGVLLVDMSYVPEGLAGYYWEFPTLIDGRPFVSRGIVAASRMGNDAYFHEILARRGVSSEGALRKVWPIRHFDPRERFSQPRMLLVGDAMGSDPLFSEGISQGLAGGKLAAEAIDHAFGCANLSFSGFTKSVLRSRFGRELTAYSRAARFLYGPHAELVLSLLYNSPKLRDLIGMSYAGTSNMAERIPRLVGHLAHQLLQFRKRRQSFRDAAALPSNTVSVAATESVGAAR